MPKKTLGFLLVLALLAACLLAGCGGEADPPAPSSAPAEATPPAQSETPPTSAEEERFVMVEITMEKGGVIKLQLDREAAPITVENFEALASDGFYDGLTFHRIIDGFMIQGGDPNGDGSGGPGHHIKGEFAANGWDNPIKHDRGTISMARGGHDPDSAGSQFFITNGDSPHLDGQYAAFGTVVEGMDVVDRIAQGPVNGDAAAEPEVMATVRIVE